MKTQSTKKVQRLVFAALFTAIIVIATAYPNFTIAVGAGGYVHPGDAFIYLAACLLPAGYAMAAGALGGAMADLLVAPVWAPYTFVVKALLSLCFSSRKSDRIVTARNALGTVPAAVVTVGGYYIAEVVMTKSFLVPVASMGFNAVQAGGSAVLFLAVGLALDRFSVKRLFPV